MRFFHISDMHIGKVLHGYSLKEDQEYVLNQIVEKAKDMQPQAVLVAGDVYDKSIPSSEAVNILDEFLTKLSVVIPQSAIMIVGGNHDGAERLEFAKNILNRQNIYIEGVPPTDESQYIKKVVLEDEFGEINFYLLPFVKPGYVRTIFEEPVQDYNSAVRLLIERENVDFKKRNVIVSHQFYTAVGQETLRSDSELITVGGLDNVDISHIKKFDYVALGHIHRRQQVGESHIRYSGSILKYSLSEQNQDKGFEVVTLGEKTSDSLEVEITNEFVPLIPLRDVREIKGTLEEVLAAVNEDNRNDYVSVVLTNEQELYRPKDRLEQEYTNIIEVRIDNLNFRQKLQENDVEGSFEEPFEAFEQFFETMNGRKLNDDESKIIFEIIDKAKEMRSI